MNKNSRIYIAGHRGLVGHNLLKYFEDKGYSNLFYAPKSLIDLRIKENVNAFFKSRNPEYVFICAAHVGGVLENDTHSADIIYNNTMIQTNIIKACHDYKVKKTMFLGSSCIYPNTILNRNILESDLLSDKLEPTNIGYSMSKLNGITMCQLYNKQYGDNFISVMPCNLFGSNDRYDITRGHVLASLIKKVYDAKVKSGKYITLWGNGEALREFLYIDDLIDAMIFLMKKYNDQDIINIGTGQDITINDLALLIMDIMGYKCAIKYDVSKPKGTYRKTLDVSKINKLGWKAKVSLKAGIKKTIDNYTKQYHDGIVNENN